MKILIEESVLRQALDSLELSNNAIAPLSIRVEDKYGLGKAYNNNNKVKAALRTALDAAEKVEPSCNPHPDAPHGFCRDASHSVGRYVCECEGWEPPTNTDSELREAARAVVERWTAGEYGLLEDELDRLRKAL